MAKRNIATTGEFGFADRLLYKNGIKTRPAIYTANGRKFSTSPNGHEAKDGTGKMVQYEYPTQEEFKALYDSAPFMAKDIVAPAGYLAPWEGGNETPGIL